MITSIYGTVVRFVVFRLPFGAKMDDLGGWVWGKGHEVSTGGQMETLKTHPFPLDVGFSS